MRSIAEGQSHLNGPITDQNAPVQKWSCYCLGLLVLVLFKIALNLRFLLLFYLSLIFTTNIAREPSLFFVFMCIATFLDVIDIIFGLVIFVSVCLKWQKVMEIYYRYSIYIFGLLTVSCFIILCFNYPVLSSVLPLLFELILVLLLQVCINCLVKNEVKKLRSNVQNQL